jgi:glutamate 5-kinase
MHKEGANMSDTKKQTPILVVKVGTTTITHPSGQPNLGILEQLTRTLHDVQQQGHQVVLVSSGAIGMGRAWMGMEKPKDLPAKQALAAIGQVRLMYLYNKLFGEYGHKVAQVLLTKDELTGNGRRHNALNTLHTLLDMGVIPIVNENDTVATDEIESGGTFGDNDTLSAMVAVLLQAEMLIMLSDVDGLFDRNPKGDSSARLIPEVCGVDDAIRGLSQDTDNDWGRGGMHTKVEAACLCTAAGIPAVITNGNTPRNIQAILSGAPIGTRFIPGEK